MPDIKDTVHDIAEIVKPRLDATFEELKEAEETHSSWVHYAK